MTPLPTLVLASASPRRRELLEAAGFQVSVQPADVDETPWAGEAAADYVLRLARAKARAIRAQGWVLGADTVVVLDGALLGKPADDDEARAMLARLSGRQHEVMTGVCLLGGGREAARVESTRVWFAPLSPDEIAAYVSTGEPRDKAGAYAIQGRAARFIPGIEGSYANVVGLPIATVWAMYRELSIPE